MQFSWELFLTLVEQTQHRSEEFGPGLFAEVHLFWIEMSPCKSSKNNSKDKTADSFGRNGSSKKHVSFYICFGGGAIFKLWFSLCKYAQEFVCMSCNTEQTQLLQW